MSNKSVSTSVDDLRKLINKAGSDPKLFKSLISALTKTMPIKASRRKLMVDENINKSFYIKRTNYDVIAKIENLRSGNFYSAKIVSIEKGAPCLDVGDTFLISKRELEITAHPTSSVDN